MECTETATVTLWRSVERQELARIEASAWFAFPPRLPESPIIYPVLTEAYAAQIARKWNAMQGGGWVTTWGQQPAGLRMARSSHSKGTSSAEPYTCSHLPLE